MNENEKKTAAPAPEKGGHKKGGKGGGYRPRKHAPKKPAASNAPRQTVGGGTDAPHSAKKGAPDTPRAAKKNTQAPAAAEKPKAPTHRSLIGKDMPRRLAD